MNGTDIGSGLVEEVLSFEGNGFTKIEKEPDLCMGRREIIDQLNLMHGQELGDGLYFQPQLCFR